MRFGWAISGQGMIARAVIEASRAGLLRSSVDLVVFDRVGPTDAMIAYCTERGISHAVLEPRNLASGIIELRRQHGLDWLGLTFNRILPRSVIAEFQEKIFNFHFSLLPSFPGFGPIRKALEAKLPYTGVTVHLIDEGIDTGPIIAQRRVNILPADTEQTLGWRQFCSAVPLAIQTVRRAELGGPLSFADVDQDVELFSQRFCESLT